MPTTPRLHRLTVPAALALSLIASCSSARPGHDHTANTPTPADHQTLHLPIEQYMLTPAQSAQYDWVRGAIVRDCLRGYGFVYPGPAHPSTDPSVIEKYSPLYRRYGVTDPASVRVWGYHAPRENVDAPAPKPAGPDEYSPDVQRVLTGTDPTTHTPAASYHGTPIPAGGCLSAPSRELPGADGGPQGPGDGVNGVVTLIKRDSFTASLADPRVTAAFAAWSACMRTRGYHLTDPLHATAGLPLDDPSPSRAEITQAEADVACKISTNLVGVWFAVETAYQDTAIHQHADELEPVTAALRQEAQRLQQLTATL